MSTIILRPYQNNLKTDIYKAWQTVSNILAVLPTGGGKTAVFAKILADHQGHSCAIAHRRELISQISLTLAQFGVNHNILAPKDIIKWIIRLHVEEVGRSFFHSTSYCTVVSIDTLKSRMDTLRDWMKKITLWVTDECHHILQKNKWGKAIALFPNARGLGLTATPYRADGHGLGRHADGVFDVLIEGPTQRELINMGYLTDYRIFNPPSDLNLKGVDISSSTGDFNPTQLRQRIQKSHIVGDVVKHYLRIAPGKLGLTFATDVQTASEIAAQYNAANVRAEVVCAKTPGKHRIEIERRFRNKQLDQLVNVDIYGEGVDVPAIEVVSFARPSESLPLVFQQFGRPMRPMPGKAHAIIIDHVNNIARHGLPDAVRVWSLDRRERRTLRDPNIMPVRTCQACRAMYEAIYRQCPYCGHVWVPAERSRPDFVDGDLTELDPSTLTKMRGEIKRIDAPDNILHHKMQLAGASQLAVAGACKNHRLRQDAQKLLRESIAWYAGHQQGVPSEIYRRFYFRFGIDMATAQTLGRREAHELMIKINRSINA